MKLGTLFSDHAVLQQRRSVAVWGETLPGLLIEAEIAGKRSFARASSSGEFKLDLPPSEAGGPYDLTVFSPENEAEKVIVHDVLFGEVWLCSGQSNMQYKLDPKRPPSDQQDVPVWRQQKDEFIAAITEPERFRFITCPNRVTGCREKYFDGAWKYMDAENAPLASAVGAWFGSFLREKLDVPVGLICCSWGGSIIESWTSPAALKTNPYTRPMIEEWEAVRQKRETWCDHSGKPAVAKAARPDDGNSGFGKGWAAPGFDDSQWKTMKVPGSWIAQHIAGNGAVWIRRTVEIPAELAGKDLVFRSGGIDKHDTTYFNGVEIGRTGKDLEADWWETPREYAIPGKLVKAGVNTLAIRGFSFLMDGAFVGHRDDWRLEADGWQLPISGEWKAAAEYDRGKLLKTTDPGLDNQNTPGLKFDTMVRPLLPFAIGGVIWYQGESNAPNVEKSLAYQREMETMIRDWRFHWENPDLPFIQVQLADYQLAEDYYGSSSWAFLRDSQLKAARAVPDSYLVTALDTGEENEIHPQDKKSIGERLAASALYHVYGLGDLPCGPEFRRAVPENGALRVYFDYADGMELRGEPGRSFYLAGADRKYHPADEAEISGDSILLRSKQVPEPLSVRYAWSNNPVSILYNRRFPAASFSSEKEEERGDL
ncbi:MAG: hypothetical protein IJS14_09105 [Lentisphaeria bacterium]|nr:hypothetical protein [Lentisphaeria bacterium]